MSHCHCHEKHVPKRIVITGGPGAGKTAVLELIRRSFCSHVRVLPESAGIVFGGGFPRGPNLEMRRAGQRAIFHVQRELERAHDPDDRAIVLCDRGTVDGVAYWTGEGDLLSDVGTTLDAELRRYHMVIHVRTPTQSNGYNKQNPLRIETVEEAEAIDARIAIAWASHPHRVEVPASPDFMTKAAQVVALVRAEIPECCRGGVRTHSRGAQS